MTRHLLADDDFSKEDVLRVFSVASDLKSRPVQPMLPIKNLALVFARPSTRTRISFEVGINQLGGSAIYIPLADTQVSRGESVADFARTVSRYADGIIARVPTQAELRELAANSAVPVINGLTREWHPCQALSDCFTIQERKGKLEGVKIAFIGDGGSNVARSLIRTASKLGAQVTVGCPKEFAPDKAVLKGTKAKVVAKAREAAKGADVVYTDTWISMGDEAQAEKRTAALKPFQVNASIMKAARKDAIFMHCLPAHRGDEATSEVIDGPQSAVFDQAENRLHVQKAVMALLMR
jgi:ornithine carbamoyltransferase